MNISAKYDPSSVEDKWYAYWLKNKFFHSEPNDKEPYTIVIPPPNVTGVLHMGHMLNNTIQDVLVRRARMKGKNACWVPGTDHASIATEAKVVAKLKAEGIEKSSLTREEFLQHAWAWREKHGGIILEQLKKLGGILNILQGDPEVFLKGSTAGLDEAAIEEAIAARAAAKKAKDYARADEIRKHLAEQGVMLVDTPRGTTWQRVLVEKSN